MLSCFYVTIWICVYSVPLFDSDYISDPRICFPEYIALTAWSYKFLFKPDSSIVIKLIYHLAV